MKHWLALLLVLALAIGTVCAAESDEAPAKEAAPVESKAAEKPAEDAPPKSEVQEKPASEPSSAPETSEKPSGESAPESEDKPSEPAASSAEIDLSSASAGNADGDSGAMSSAVEDDGAAIDRPVDAAGTQSADTGDEEVSAPGDPPENPEAPADEAVDEATDGKPTPSDRVLRIQGYLIRLGYLSASHRTGIYDDATRSAVARFQADMGLSVTGECDGNTFSLLAEKAGASGTNPGADAESTGRNTDSADANDHSDLPDEDGTSDALAEGDSAVSDPEVDGETVDTADDGSGEIDNTDEAADGEILDDESLEANGRPRPPETGDIGNADDADEVDLYGLNDAQILKVQDWLFRLGYLTEDQQSGLYDEILQAAIAAFQADNEIELTDVCDSVTYRLIYETCLAQLQSQGAFPGGFHGGFSRGGMGGFGGGMAGGTPEGEAEDDPLNGITPGEALTSDHASGDRDATYYGALSELSPDALNLTLRTGTSADNLTETNAIQSTVIGGSFFLDGGTLLQEWTLDGSTLRALSRSGIERLGLGGNGGTLWLNTASTLRGEIYDALRSRGQTDNTFEYRIILSADNAQIHVSAGDSDYEAVVSADGTLALIKGNGGEVRA